MFFHDVLEDGHDRIVVSRVCDICLEHTGVVGQFEPESPSIRDSFPALSFLTLSSYSKVSSFVSLLQDNRIIVIYRYALVDSIDNSSISLSSTSLSSFISDEVSSQVESANNYF
jgi:hypothetical protein